MKTVIADLVEGLALPPDGIDLRAELADLQSARVRQALEQADGELGQAARLLRMSRLELLRLEARLILDDAPPPATPDPPTLPRISDGVALISAAAIRRYADEGRNERWIASQLGCNPFMVEKVLRERTAAEIVRLDREERLAVDAIAAKLRIPRTRVRHVLRAADASEQARAGEVRVVR